MKYNEEFHPLLIQSLLQNGISLDEVAAKIGVTKSLILVWRNKYPKVKEAIIKGREPVDANVIASLYKNAIGYTYKETVLEPARLTKEQIEERGKMKNPPPIPLVKKRAITKHVPPNVIAQIFWLKNRLPDDWKDRQNVSIASKVEYNIKLPPMPSSLKKVGETVINSKEVQGEGAESVKIEIKSDKEIEFDDNKVIEANKRSPDDTIDISKEF